MANHTMQERMDAAAEAKKAMLEKFKKQSSDPDLASKREEQMKLAQDRDAKRAAAEEKRRARVEEEKKARQEAAVLKQIEAEEAAKHAAEEAERKRAADAEAAEILAFEQKARRDLKYAQRKARQAGKR